MKYKLTFALVAALTSTAFAGFQAPLPEFKNEKQLAEWRTEKASEATSQRDATEEAAFYTGKPFLASSGGYAFKYRSYNPELARWTSEDPSGFKDGANQNIYTPNPNTEVDFAGLWRIVLVNGTSGSTADQAYTLTGLVTVWSSQWVNADSFGISSVAQLGGYSGLQTDTSMSGYPTISPGGNEISLMFNRPHQSLSGALVSSAVSVANITYSDSNKTVSFNLTYGGAPSLTGLDIGVGGVSTSGGGIATGFSTIKYTLVE